MKMVKKEKVETFDFPKGGKAEPFVKAEPLELPKMENSERFVKTETLDSPKIETKNLSKDFSKAETVKQFGLPLAGSTFRDEKREFDAAIDPDKRFHQAAVELSHENSA